MPKGTALETNGHPEKGRKLSKIPFNPNVGNPKNQHDRFLLVIKGKEVASPVLRALVVSVFALLTVTILAVITILLIGVVTTLKIGVALVLVVSTTHLLLRLSGRRGLVEVARLQTGVTQISFDPKKAFDKVT